MARLDPPKGSESVSSKEWSAIARFSLRVESITVKNFSRFTHSRPFQKSTFHTTCSGKRYRSGKLSLARIFRARVEGGGKEEGREKRGFKRRHSNHSFAILERKYVRSNEERGDATISRTSRSKVRFDSFLFLPFLRVFSIGKKKKKKEGKRRNSTLNGEGRNRNGRGGNSRGFPIVVVIPRPARWPTRFEWKSNGRVAGIGK